MKLFEYLWFAFLDPKIISNWQLDNLWLVASTPQKNISQLGRLLYSQYMEKNMFQTTNQTSFHLGFIWHLGFAGMFWFDIVACSAR